MGILLKKCSLIPSVWAENYHEEREQFNAGSHLMLLWPQSVGHNVVGVALLHVVPEFTEDGSEDWVEYRLSFEGFATAHCIPESHCPNKLFIKLRAKAKSWYKNTFQANTFPPRGQLT